MRTGWKKPTAWANSSQADGVAAYYAAGHSVRDTAEHFGVSVAQVNNLAKRRHISNGRQFHGGPTESSIKGLAKANAARMVEAEKHIAERMPEFGFDYIGGYAGRRGKIRVRCRRCGCESELTLSFLKNGTSPVCEECKKREADAKREEDARNRAVKEAAKEQEKQRTKAEKDDALFHLLNDKTHICAVCGEAFSIADYMKDCGLKQIQHNPRYCSDACKRRANHRKSKECKKRSGNYDRGNHRHRAMKYGVPYESGITLKKVWERDNGICQICGKPCDWSDRSWNDYCGPLYPSIDHIIALANGGGHVLDNVQLAHIICNSEKGATIEETS